jgi:hypothetical protein
MSTDKGVTDWATDFDFLGSEWIGRRVGLRAGDSDAGHRLHARYLRASGRSVSKMNS